MTNLARVAALTGYVPLEKVVAGTVPSPLAEVGLIAWGLVILLV